MHSVGKVLNFVLLGFLTSDCRIGFGLLFVIIFTVDVQCALDVVILIAEVSGSRPYEMLELNFRVLRPQILSIYRVDPWLGIFLKPFKLLSVLLVYLKTFYFFNLIYSFSLLTLRNSPRCLFMNVVTI